MHTHSDADRRRGRPRLGPLPIPHLQRASGAAGVQPHLSVLFLAVVDQRTAP